MELESKYASLAFLSYNRAQFIGEGVVSAVRMADYPVEVLVHDDGSSPEVIPVLLELLDKGFISHLILNRQGHNEGVGEAIRRMFDMATGDPVIKLDQDMLFTDGWLRKAVNILEVDESIGMLGFFKYNHEPVDWRKMRIHVKPEPLKHPDGDDMDADCSEPYHYTRQFCGSGFAIPRSVFRELGPLDHHLDAFNEDSNYMAKVRGSGLELALPDEDLARNRGFGIGPSTVVEEGYKVHEIHHEPYVIAPRVPVPAPFAHDFVPGIVITTCAGREDNLRRVMQCVQAQTRRPERVVIVADGCEPCELLPTSLDVTWATIEKHGPGQVQPRNVGVHVLKQVAPECNYVWFLDSDIIVQNDCLAELEHGLNQAEEERILIAPYDWLAPNQVGFCEDRNDPRIAIKDYRWAMFDEHTPADVLRHHLGAGLGNFSGNLVWPIDRFVEVGGFNQELHHGRCEDGELGIRACEHGVPMSLVANARGWHVWHPIDIDAVRAKNARDVPLLNAMHPWVQDAGLIVVDKDGKRFDWKCPDCGEVFNTLDFWPHSQTHHQEA